MKETTYTHNVKVQKPVYMQKTLNEPTLTNGHSSIIQEALRGGIWGAILTFL